MSQAADSAGVPFAGRQFQPHPFAGDDGQRPAGLAEALSQWAATPSGQSMSAVVEALRTDRVLVPLIAEAGEYGETPEGRVVEKTQELSIVTVEGPGGTPVGLVFSDTEALQAWRAEARPQATESVRAAAWALEEGISRLVLNPTAADECVVRRGALVALVTGEPYRVPWDDDEITEAVAAAVGADGAIRLRSGWELLGGGGPDLVVEVALPAGLTAEQLTERQQRWAGGFAKSEVLRLLVDGMHLSLVASSS